MQFRLISLFLFSCYSQIECIRIGLIPNVSLTGENGLKKNVTSCYECACLLALNTTFVSLNCYLLNASCELFSSYNVTIDYQVQYNFNSVFYFLQLPQIFTMTTIESKETTKIQVTNETIQTSTIATTKIAITTPSTSDPCPYTAAGRCNSTSGSDSYSLNTPMDVYVSRDGSTLYVGEWGNNRVQAFQLPSKSGTTVATSLNGVVGIYFDDNVSKLYVAEFSANKLSIWPSGHTLPLNGTTACTLAGGWFSGPYAVVGDTQGNIYVCHNTCYSIVKWTPNSTIPIRIGGTGTSGATSLQLNSPRHIYLDEVNSFIYVADTSNHRVQRFAIDGNGTGVTVAGGNGSGKGSTQLNSPAGVYVSWKDGSVYVSDRANNRIQKWAVNATFGITVAGYSNGTAGAGSVALNQPYAVTLDRNETWMYIADYNNNRVQRFPVV